MFLICIICVFNVHVLAAAAESADVDIISELRLIKEQFMERENLYERKLAEMEDRLRNAEENSKSLENRQNSVEKFFKNRIAELEHKLYETAYGHKAEDINDNEKLPEVTEAEEILNENEITRQHGPGMEPAMKPSKVNSKETDTGELLTTDHVPQEMPLFHRKLRSKGKRQLTSPGTFRVAFSSFLSTTTNNLGYQQTIPFDQVLLNEGQSFNTVSHSFICPVNGIYMFQSSLLCDQGDHTETEIVKDGSVLARQYSSGDTRITNVFGQGFNSATVRCNKGEMVWIRIRGRNGNVVYAEQFSTFSGFLLWEI